jgi:hypothetical protein
MSKRTTVSEKRLAVSRAAPLQRRAADSAKTPAVTLGRLVGVGSEGQPWIDLPAYGRTGAAAKTTVPLGASLVGREVVVSFLDGNCDQPVVTGVVQRAGDAAAAGPVSLDAIVDGERVLLTGRREVVLRCGKASIALAADGRVVIKGVSFLATSSGLHRIRGGAVQIN